MMSLSCPATCKAVDALPCAAAGRTPRPCLLILRPHRLGVLHGSSSSPYFLHAPLPRQAAHPAASTPAPPGGGRLRQLRLLALAAIFLLPVECLLQAAWQAAHAAWTLQLACCLRGLHPTPLPTVMQATPFIAALPPLCALGVCVGGARIAAHQRQSLALARGMPSSSSSSSPLITPTVSLLARSTWLLLLLHVLLDILLLPLLRGPSRHPKDVGGYAKQLGGGPAQAASNEVVGVHGGSCGGPRGMAVRGRGVLRHARLAVAACQALVFGLLALHMHTLRGGLLPRLAAAVGCGFWLLSGVGALLE